MALLTESLLLDAVIFLTSCVLLFHLYFQHKFSYWKKRGVPYAEPSMLFGNFKNCFLQKECVGQFFRRLYEQGSGHRFYGIYLFARPALILRDPELIKQILVKDFNIFYDRQVHSSAKSDPLSNNLFTLKGTPWKYLRVKMTPIFTPLRVKNMFPFISKCATQLTDYLKEASDKGERLEMKEVAGKYATDVITTCAFGIESNCLSNPNAEFRELGKKAVEFSTYRAFEFMSIFLLPLMVKLMDLKFFSTEGTKFLRRAFWETLKYREENNIVREDVMRLLIQLKNKGHLDEEKQENGANGVHNNESLLDKSTFEFNGDNLVAQAAIFFTAGFESNATTTSATLYELAMQPHLQTRLREEVIAAMEKDNGELTYDTIKDLEYLHMVISETLRRIPPLSILDRVASRDYVIPGTKTVIEKGTVVYVPLLGIHNDVDAFPNPDQYDPERFSEENKKKRHPFMYLPFGEGPKYCLGKGLGLIAIKIAVASVISQYEVLPCENTPPRLDLDPKAMILAVKGGLPLRFAKLKK
ncbi:cytochrome P450 6k1-like [Periplaneta americana]|uniref:cytochrome P450 6k1-like n=1 Tax=Periplaneta americana TaxID=6978 RepID=UPI0037E735E3